MVVFNVGHLQITTVKVHSVTYNVCTLVTYQPKGLGRSKDQTSAAMVKHSVVYHEWTKVHLRTLILGTHLTNGDMNLSLVVGLVSVKFVLSVCQRTPIEARWQMHVSRLDHGSKFANSMSLINYCNLFPTEIIIFIWSFRSDTIKPSVPTIVVSMREEVKEHIRKCVTCCRLSNSRGGNSEINHSCVSSKTGYLEKISLKHE